MRRYLIFASVALALFLSAVGGTTVSVAFPVIVTDLNASLVMAGWVLSVYQLVAIAAMPLSARLSEVFGRKQTFLLCTSLFTAGSILCALASDVRWLIFFRVIQALGGGGFLPTAASIVSEEFPDMRQKALGLFTSIFPIGAIVGPNVGGWMVTALGWKSVFWLNAPIGITILVLAQVLVRRGKGNGSRNIDILGAGLLTGCVTALMWAFTEMSNPGAGTPWPVVGLLMAASAAMLYGFLRWERKAPEPIIDLRLLRGRPFASANMYNLVYGACAFGIFSLIPLYAVSIYNMPTLESGLILTPRSVGMMVASTVVSFSLIKWGYRWPILVGTATIVASLFLLAFELHGVNALGIYLGPTALLLVILSLSGIGVGISAPAANNACIELMPDRVATITGLRGMFRQMGGAISISIATVLLEGMDSASRAFNVVFVGLGIIMLLSVPLIFAMPRNANSPTN